MDVAKDVVYEVADRIATITLNRPEVANVQNAALLDAQTLLRLGLAPLELAHARQIGPDQGAEPSFVRHTISLRIAWRGCSGLDALLM